MADNVTQDPAIQTAATDVASDVPKVVSDVENKNVGGIISDVTNDYNQLAPVLPQVIEETKAGYKTTEFYLVILYEILTQSGAIHLPGTYGKVAAGAAGIVAYVLSRGIAKAGVPYRQFIGIHPHVK